MNSLSGLLESLRCVYFDSTNYNFYKLNKISVNLKPEIRGSANIFHQVEVIAHARIITCEKSSKGDLSPRLL